VQAAAWVKPVFTGYALIGVALPVADTPPAPALTSDGTSQPPIRNCLFMTDSPARQLGYRLLVGFELEPLAATNSQKSDAPIGWQMACRKHAEQRRRRAPGRSAADYRGRGHRKLTALCKQRGGALCPMG
jgi:hypothetical protein